MRHLIFLPAKAKRSFAGGAACNAAWGCGARSPANNKQKFRKETTREILANGDDVNRTGSGTSGETVEQDDFLSNIIEELNNKIGLKLDSKALIPYIKNIKEQLMADEQLKNVAKQNEECDFATVYYNKIEAIFVQELKNLYGIGDSSEVEGLSKKEKEDRIEFARAMMNVEMRRRIFGMYLDEVHQKMRGEDE